jgi:hypothetical protein
MSAGFLIANHARKGPGSLLSRLCKRLWDDGKKEPDSAAGQRKKLLAAAEQRRSEVPLPLYTLLCAAMCWVVVLMLE